MDVVLLIPVRTLSVRQSQNQSIAGVINELWCTGHAGLPVCLWTSAGHIPG